MLLELVLGLGLGLVLLWRVAGVVRVVMVLMEVEVWLLCRWCCFWESSLVLSLAVVVDSEGVMIWLVVSVLVWACCFPSVPAAAAVSVVL